LSPKVLAISAHTIFKLEQTAGASLIEALGPSFRVRARSIDELQADLDLWICEYNEQRPHQGRWCFGKTAGGAR
jgi:hypothetical protein